MVIGIAGIALEVSPSTSLATSQLGGYRLDCEPELAISPERLASVAGRIAEQDSASGEGACESAAMLELAHEALLPYGRMFFHSALVELDGWAYAISGPSGAGKTTHARLWRDELGATVINGDKPFLRREGGAWSGSSSPWTGKEAMGEPGRLQRLRAIGFIRQADENSARRLSKDEAVELILRQSRMPEDVSVIDVYLDLVNKLSGEVPVFSLECDASREAARMAWEAMSSCE